MRTETLIKLLRLSPMPICDIYAAMGGTWESVTEAINDAVSRKLVTWQSIGLVRYYMEKK